MKPLSLLTYALLLFASVGLFSAHAALEGGSGANPTAYGQGSYSSYGQGSYASDVGSFPSWSDTQNFSNSYSQGTYSSLSGGGGSSDSGKLDKGDTGGNSLSNSGSNSSSGTTYTPSCGLCSVAQGVISAVSSGPSALVKAGSAVVDAVKNSLGLQKSETFTQLPTVKDTPTKITNKPVETVDSTPENTQGNAPVPDSIQQALDRQRVIEGELEVYTPQQVTIRNLGKIEGYDVDSPAVEGALFLALEASDNNPSSAISTLKNIEDTTNADLNSVIKGDIALLGKDTSDASKELAKLGINQSELLAKMEEVNEKIRAAAAQDQKNLGSDNQTNEDIEGVTDPSKLDNTDRTTQDSCGVLCDAGNEISELGDRTVGGIWEFVLPSFDNETDIDTAIEEEQALLAQQTEEEKRALLDARVRAISRGPGVIESIYGTSDPRIIDAVRDATGNAPQQTDPRLVDRGLITIGLALGERYGLPDNQGITLASELARTMVGEVGLTFTDVDRAAAARSLTNRLDIAASTPGTLNAIRTLMAYDANGYDINRTGPGNRVYQEAVPGTKAYSSGLQAVVQAMSSFGILRDAPYEVQNATHYFNPDKVNPKWGTGAIRFGVHSFVTPASERSYAQVEAKRNYVLTHQTAPGETIFVDVARIGGRTVNANFKQFYASAAIDGAVEGTVVEVPQGDPSFTLPQIQPASNLTPQQKQYIEYVQARAAARIAQMKEAEEIAAKLKVSCPACTNITLKPDGAFGYAVSFTYTTKGEGAGLTLEEQLVLDIAQRHGLDTENPSKQLFALLLSYSEEKNPDGSVRILTAKEYEDRLNLIETGADGSDALDRLADDFINGTLTVRPSLFGMLQIQNVDGGVTLKVLETLNSNPDVLKENGGAPLTIEDAAALLEQKTQEFLSSQQGTETSSEVVPNFFQQTLEEQAALLGTTKENLVQERETKVQEEYKTIKEAYGESYEQPQQTLTEVVVECAQNAIACITEGVQTLLTLGSKNEPTAVYPSLIDTGTTGEYTSLPQVQATPIAKPDLSLHTPKVSKGVGDEYRFQAFLERKLENANETLARDLQKHFSAVIESRIRIDYGCNGTYDTQEISSLPYRLFIADEHISTILISEYIPVTQTGTHCFTVETDIQNSIDELNEQNNGTQSISFTTP